MAHPRGTPKPQACNRRPHRPENRENLASLTSEVLHLCLEELNLPITGSKAQLVKHLPTDSKVFSPRKKAGWSCLLHSSIQSQRMSQRSPTTLHLWVQRMTLKCHRTWSLLNNPSNRTAKHHLRLGSCCHPTDCTTIRR